jgi:hypothetical protein
MGTKETTAYSFEAPTMPPKALMSSSSSAPLARLSWSSLAAAVSLAAGCESARYSVVKAENAERRALSLGSFCSFSPQYLLKAGAGLWPSQALLAQRGKSTFFLSKIRLAVWANVSFFPTIMAGLKLGPFVELEKPLRSLVIDMQRRQA